MMIGTFEERIKVETKRRFSTLWCSLLDDFNQDSTPDMDRRIVNGVQRGLIACLKEVTEWLNTPDVV